MHGKQKKTKIEKRKKGSFHNFTQMTYSFDRSGSLQLFLVKDFRIFMVLLYSQALQIFPFFLLLKNIQQKKHLNEIWDMSYNSIFLKM